MYTKYVGFEYVDTVCRRVVSGRGAGSVEARVEQRQVGPLKIIEERWLALEPFLLDMAINAALQKPGHVLDMGAWHAGHSGPCGTTHCRAGWAIVLHPQGVQLEKRFGSAMAAAILYHHCSVLKERPDWDADETTSLRDIQRAAELQEQQA